MADRGFISAATIAALETRGLDYILGARERTDKLVRKVVLDDPKPFVPLLIERHPNGRSAHFIAPSDLERLRHGLRLLLCAAAEGLREPDLPFREHRRDLRARSPGTPSDKAPWPVPDTIELRVTGSTISARTGISRWTPEICDNVADLIELFRQAAERQGLVRHQVREPRAPGL